MKVYLEYMDQFGTWKHYTSMHHLPSAYKTAERRATNTKKRYRLIDDEGTLLDLINP